MSPAELTATRFEGSLAADALAGPAVAGRVWIWWLGQAGFLLRGAGLLCAIDPYLAPGLRRLTPPPVAPPELTGLGAVLCSHAHVDHLDPGTLPGLARANPDCVFVVPAAERDRALEIGLPAGRLRPVRDGDVLQLAGGAELRVLPSAHEELETGVGGAHRALGFVLALDGLGVYHSGDCVPYAGLAERLARLGPDLALLPVNGRDAERRARGIVGNFTFAEAAELCLRSGIGLMIAHHFGTFAGNTVPRGVLERAAAGLPAGLCCVVPDAGLRYELARVDGGLSGGAP